jgi:Tol biopolymer transport system component
MLKNRTVNLGLAIVTWQLIANSVFAQTQSPIIQASVDSQGNPGNFTSTSPSISADGRYVAFQSLASNFAVSDTNGAFDIYMHDSLTGQTMWGSPLPSGSAGYYGSYFPCISADGRRIEFTTLDPLVIGDTGKVDVYVKDLQTGAIVRASVTNIGGQANDDSYPATISGDGKSVGFISLATNLVAFDANGGSYNTGRDVFVRDLINNTTELVDVSTSGVQGNSTSDAVSISYDGRFVAFRSAASNLVPGDTGGWADIFVRDRLLGVTTRVSVDSSGNESNGHSSAPYISSDGRYVVFMSLASNLVPGDNNGAWDSDVFVHDRQTGQTSLISVSSAGVQANRTCELPSISDDGRYVVFQSSATSLVPGDLDIYYNTYLRDRVLGTTRRVDISASGAPANATGSISVISRDGSTIAIASPAKNLVPQTDPYVDVFLVHHFEQSPIAYCTAQTTSQGCVPEIGWTGLPSATSGSGFELSASHVDPNRFATVLYGLGGPTALQYPGGTLCVGSTPARCQLIRSTGSGVCGGNLNYDFNSWIATGHDPALVTSQSVWAQFWSRDPQAFRKLNLTDAVFFVIEP